MDFTGSYKILAQISAGPIAGVYKAKCAAMNFTPVAVKVVDLNRHSAALKDDRNSTVTHPDLLHTHLFFAPYDGRFWAVMPFLPAGSLRSIMLYSFPYGIPEPCIAVVLRQLLEPLAYLHRLGKFHGDIKPGNIVINHSCTVKLADFGLSDSNYNPDMMKLLLIEEDAVYWKAPENDYTAQSDIWSFGATALELAYGGPPLARLDPVVSELLRVKIRKRFGWLRDDEERYKTVMDCSVKSFSKDFARMVSRCLNPNPWKRPSAEELMNHPFFSNPDVAAAAEDPDFLRRNLLDGLPSVENRLKEARYFDAGDSLGQSDEYRGPIDLVLNRFEIFHIDPIRTNRRRVQTQNIAVNNDGNSERQNVEHQKIISWRFSKRRLKLDPVHETPPTTPRRQRGETDDIGLKFFSETSLMELSDLDQEWKNVTKKILEIAEATTREEEIVARMWATETAKKAERARRTELKAEIASLKRQVLGRLAMRP